MMQNEKNSQAQEAKYMKAKKRIDEMRKFYKHLTVYLIVNLFISFFKINNYMDDGDTLLEALSTFDTYIVWMVWGFFLILQWVRTFNKNMFLGSDWEERKLRQYMNEK